MTDVHSIDVRANEQPEIASRDQITKPRIREILERVSGPRVLDVGCVAHDPNKRDDPNWLHQHLVREHPDVLGVDLDRDGINALRDEGYSVEVADAQRLSISGEWDTIVAGELIEHLSRPGDFLDAARAKLCEGGRVIITTPNPHAACYVARALVRDPVGNDEHTCWFSAATLQELIGRYGFNTEIIYLPPMGRGLTSLANWFGIYRLGSTRILAELTLGDQQ